MAAENFDACFSHVLGSEGGYQADERDSGNYTGCAVGKGKLLGTIWGISACSYPTLDIPNLTQDDAKAIYRSDYWDETECDLMPWGVDLCLFDSSINSGCGDGVRWLQRAVGVTADGDIGQETVDAANAADPHVTINRMCDDRLSYLKSLSTWSTYGKGWANRVENVRREAHAMQSAHPGPVFEPEPEGETVTVYRVTIRGAGPFTVTVEEEESRNA